LEYFSILVSDAVSQNGPGLTQDATILNAQTTFGRATTSEKLINAIRDAKGYQEETIKE